MFLIIETQTPFHNLFPLLLRVNTSNCWKWALSWLWCAVLTSTHLLHIFQTFFVTLQVRNKCVLVSSSSPQNTQETSVNCTPLLLRFILVGTLFMITLQAKNCAEGATFTVHNIWYKWVFPTRKVLYFWISRFNSIFTFLIFPKPRIHTLFIYWYLLYKILKFINLRQLPLKPFPSPFYSPFPLVVFPFPKLLYNFILKYGISI